MHFAIKDLININEHNKEKNKEREEKIDIIREQASISNEATTVGKLYHQILVGRWKHASL